MFGELRLPKLWLGSPRAIAAFYRLNNLAR
jgi:hypothetical protein